MTPLGSVFRDRSTRSMPSVIVHYHEIALKGRNRSWFVERLVSNIRMVTADLGVTRVRALMGRIELRYGSEDAWTDLRERLACTPGIANFSRAVRTRCDLDAITETVLTELADVQVESFRVTARRADKRFPVTSPELERQVGGRIGVGRDTQRRSVLLPPEGIRGWWFAQRCERTRSLSHVWRHRLSCGSVSDDQARMPSPDDSFPQLSDFGPHLAGQGD